MGAPKYWNTDDSGGMRSLALSSVVWRLSSTPRSGGAVAQALTYDVPPRSSARADGPQAHAHTNAAVRRLSRLRRGIKSLDVIGALQNQTWTEVQFF